MKSLKNLLAIGIQTLKDENIPDADYDSRALLEHVYGISKHDFFMNPDKNVEEEPYLDAIKKRAKRYPLQYITGEQWFMGYRFIVNENVLIPRQDTEILVEKTLNIISNMGKEKCTVLDMCTGSGCIAICLDKMCTSACVTAVDVSEKALQVARDNSTENKADINLVHSDLFGNIQETFDVIVSNPPYIPAKVIEGLMPEVRDYEPEMALNGAEDGLLFYREISREALKYLNRGGYILYEIGCEQAEDVLNILKSNGYTDINVYKDLAGLDRVVSARFE